MAGRHLLLAIALAAACGGDNAGQPAVDGGALVDAPTADILFDNFRVEEIGPTRAVARFTTSIPTSCEAEFGTAQGTLDRTATDPDMEEGELVEEHQVPLEDLTPETTYYVRAAATDGDGNTARSQIYSFTTTSDDDPTAGLINVALLAGGASVSEVSSNWGGQANSGAYGADRAFDGLMETAWATAGDGDAAYVVIDLGQERTITYLGFRSRMMTDGSSIIESVQIRAGEELRGPFATPDHTVRYAFPIDPPLTTGTVRIEAVTTSGGNTGAREVQLYSAAP